MRSYLDLPISWHQEAKASVCTTLLAPPCMSRYRARPRSPVVKFFGSENPAALVQAQGLHAVPFSIPIAGINRRTPRIRPHHHPQLKSCRTRDKRLLALIPTGGGEGG